MLSPKAQYSVVDAKKYFREHLRVGDYCTEGQHVPGQWYFKGAEDLGRSGVTTVDEFVRLCDNLNPQTGQRLTQGMKTTRTEIDANGTEHEAANRRVFCAFTFSPPKSVSVAALAANGTCYKLSRSVMGENQPMDNLRLEMNSESFYLFSYHHPKFAKFDSDKDHDTLTLSFLDHQVRIAGLHLRELAIAIQKRTVESIIQMPGRHSDAARSQAAFVKAIEVQAIEGRN